MECRTTQDLTTHWNHALGGDRVSAHEHANMRAVTHPDRDSASGVIAGSRPRERSRSGLCPRCVAEVIRAPVLKSDGFKSGCDTGHD